MKVRTLHFKVPLLPLSLPHFPHFTSHTSQGYSCSFTPFYYLLCIQFVFLHAWLTTWIVHYHYANDTSGPSFGCFCWTLIFPALNSQPPLFHGMRYVSLKFFCWHTLIVLVKRLCNCQPTLGMVCGIDSYSFEGFTSVAFLEACLCFLNII